MIGKRDAQRTLFQVPLWAQELVTSESFYARMGAFWSQVSRDEDLEGMYAEKQGKPSIPPSLMCAVLILQYFDNVSDREAADRVRYDLRWKMALDLPLDDVGFHYSSLSRFRSRLMAHGQERYAFDKLLQCALAAGFLKRDAGQVIDSTPIYGAAAVKDTYALLRNAIGKLLLAMGENPTKRRRLAKRLGLSEYLGTSKPDLDWTDPEARKEQLQKIVADAEQLAGEAQGALILLEQILAQDVDTDDEGQYEIKQGVAKDRVISTVDPEMRHGRKSASKRIDGFKGHVSVDSGIEWVTEVVVTAANVYDGEAVEPLLDNQAIHNAMAPRAVVGDQSVIDAERRRALVEREIEAVGKVGIHRPGGRYAKADFDVDLEKGTVTCPAGHMVSQSRGKRDKKGRVWQVFEFPRQQCQSCSLRDRCTTAQRTGRTVRLHPEEALLQAAREEQQKSDFRKRFTQARSTVERVISRLVRHGFRQARYIGIAKTLFQALWSAASVNLQRLMSLMSDPKEQKALRAA